MDGRTDDRGWHISSDWFFFLRLRPKPPWLPTPRTSEASEALAHPHPFSKEMFSSEIKKQKKGKSSAEVTGQSGILQ
jgi:hypothetical protein